MFCGKCGRQLADNDRYCGACGAETVNNEGSKTYQDSKSENIEYGETKGENDMEYFNENYDDMGDSRIDTIIHLLKIICFWITIVGVYFWGKVCAIVYVVSQGYSLWEAMVMM